MKRKVLILFVLCVAVLLVGCGKEDKYKDAKIVSITYSHSSSYGTVASTASRRIKLNNDGTVELSNSYDERTETFEIGKDKYDEVAEYVRKHLDLFDKKPNEDNDVFDGGYSNVKVELQDGTIKEYGGYMIINDEYDGIVDKIYEYLDKDLIKKYERSIGE